MLGTLTTDSAAYEEIIPLDNRKVLLSPSNALISGECSELAPILRAIMTRGGLIKASAADADEASDRGNDYSRSYSRNEIIAENVTAITGQYRSQKEVAYHIQSLKDFVSDRLKVNHTGSSGLVSAIASIAHMRSHALHDALYNLLHKGPLDIDDSGLFNVSDTHGLELVLESIPSVYRYAIRSIRLTYKIEDSSRIVRLLHRRDLPGLKVLYVRVYKGQPESLFADVESAEYKGALRSLQKALLGDVNPHVRIVPDPRIVPPAKAACELDLNAKQEEMSDLVKKEGSINPSWIQEFDNRMLNTHVLFNQR